MCQIAVVFVHAIGAPACCCLVRHTAGLRSLVLPETPDSVFFLAYRWSVSLLFFCLFAARVPAPA